MTDGQTPAGRGRAVAGRRSRYLDQLKHTPGRAPSSPRYFTIAWLAILAVVVAYVSSAVVASCGRPGTS